MCLIMYSPNGQLPPKAVWDQAKEDNPDGIGVMSERAIVKWVGKRGYAKAWKHISKLNQAGVPFAVHFRWRTHGAIVADLCHPHATDVGSYLMHNGVLGSTSQYATPEKSDTRLYVEWYLAGIREWQTVRPLIEGHIGGGNKFVVMDESKEFHIMNEHCGIYHNGIWYSNDYSFGFQFDEELEQQNAGYKPYRSFANYGLGYDVTTTKSAKQSAETLLRKPSIYESSEAWQEYYTELYDRGEISEDELDDIMVSQWEASDMEDRDDFDDYDYSDRRVRL